MVGMFQVGFNPSRPEMLYSDNLRDDPKARAAKQIIRLDIEFQLIFMNLCLT